MSKTTFAALGTNAVVAVADDAALGEAQAMLVEQLERLDLTCSRFRSDSASVRCSAGTLVPPSARNLSKAETAHA